MKRLSKRESLRRARHRNANLKFSTKDEDEDSDENPLSKSILRTFMNVRESWRTCRRRACKRGRGCRGRDVQCLFGQPPGKPPRDPAKAARDEAREMAIFQRRVTERVEELGRRKNGMATEPATPARRPRQI